MLLTKIGKRNFKGNIQFIISFAEEIIFDKMYHVKTSGIIPLSQLKIDSKFVSKYHQYEAVKVRHFKTLMKQLKFPDESVFVDIGSGMGRVILLASLFSFQRIVGIEISSELCDIAKKNWANYQNKTHNNTQVEIYNLDVLEYSFKDDENIFFLFNPFKKVIIESFLKKIEASLKKKPRQAWILYHKPDYSSPIDNSDIFRKQSEFHYAGRKNYIYCNVD